MRNAWDTRPPPAVLPMVALVLSVIGLCFPPLLLVSTVLAVVSLVRSGEPAYAPRRTLAIVSLVVSLTTLPVIGVVAAIAIPNFVRFQTRTRQAECQQALKAAATAQRSYFAEFDRYSTSPAEVGFVAPAEQRYLYRFADQGPLEEVGLAPPQGGAQLDAALPEQLRALAGVHGQCPRCEVTVVCAGNLDPDPALDVWSVSTADRQTAAGEPVPALTPFQHLDDVTDEAQQDLQEADAPTPVRGAAAEPEPETVDQADDQAWVSYSADGTTTLRQHSEDQDCVVECVPPQGTPAWRTRGACLASRGERRFVSADCRRTVVLVPAPDRGKDWARTEVMRVYADGALEYAVSGSTVLPERFIRTSTSWLQGCFGVPGPEPRYTSDGLAVEYVMVNGEPGRVPLVREVPEAQPAPPAKKPNPKRKRR